MSKLVSATVRIRNVSQDILDTVIELLEESPATRVKVMEIFDSPAGMEQPK